MAKATKVIKEGVVTMLNEDSELVGIIYRDAKSRKNILYTCTEMSVEEITEFISNSTN